MTAEVTDTHLDERTCPPGHGDSVNIYKGNLFNKADALLIRAKKDYLKRTYEDKTWYLIVLSPYENSYAKHKDWYNGTKCVQSVKRRLQPLSEVLIITREKIASKTHLNVLMCTSSTIPKINPNKFYNNIQTIKDSSDRFRTCDYIFKEIKNRTFSEHDYHLFMRHRTGNNNIYKSIHAKKNLYEEETYIPTEEEEMELKKECSSQ